MWRTQSWVVFAFEMAEDEGVSGRIVVGVEGGRRGTVGSVLVSFLAWKEVGGSERDCMWDYGV